MGAVLLLGIALRVHLLDAPLERDEGEYAYAGQLLLQGVPPYQLAYNMKFPGIYAIYAVLLAIFGQTARGIHLGLLVVNACTTLLLFLVGKRLSSSMLGLVASACFAVFSSTYAVHGANAEYFVILPALGGVLLLLHALDTCNAWHFLGSGLLLGTGFLIKQPGAAFIGFAMVVIGIDGIKSRISTHRTWIRHVLWLGFGALLPLATACFALYLAGTFEKFWFWTVSYATEYGSLTSLQQAWANLGTNTSRVYSASPTLWWLVVLGLILLKWNHRAASHRPTILLFAGFSVLAICPGLYFRPHYFVLLLPAASLLAGSAVESLCILLSRTRARGVRNVLPIGLAVLCLASTVSSQRHFNFFSSPIGASRTAFAFNPFPEAREIGAYIRTHSNSGDRIAVIGSEPEIYFYANRQSATGYIYTYALMEPHPYAQEMQREMIEEIEAASPEFLVFVNMYNSWLWTDASYTQIFTWFERYRSTSYDLIAAVDVAFQGSTYHWAPHLPPAPTGPNWITVYKRR